MRMNRIILSSFCVLLAVALSSARSIADEPEYREYKSTHYVLRTDMADFAEEALAVLEAFYENAADFYGATPGNAPLAVNLFSTRDRVNAFMAGHGGGRVDSGGIYIYSTSAANLYEQPTKAYTRHLLVHECAHQFFHLSVGRNAPNVPCWLDEGLAEYFGSHVWDGKVLLFGRLDLVRLDNNIRLIEFKRHLADPGRKFSKIFEKDWQSNYSDPWGIVNFLIGHPVLSKKFPKFVRTIGKGGVEGSVEHSSELIFKKVFGFKPAAMEKELRKYYADKKPAWRVVWTDWDGGGNRIAGRSTVTGLLVSTRGHDEVKKISCGLELLKNDGAGKAGILCAYTDTDNFVEVAIEGRRNLAIIARRSGKWERLGEKSLQPSMLENKGGTVLSVEFSGDDKIAAYIDGKEFFQSRIGVEFAGKRVGLFVDATECVFLDVEIE